MVYNVVDILTDTPYDAKSESDYIPEFSSVVVAAYLMDICLSDIYLHIIDGKLCQYKKSIVIKC